MRVRRRRAVLAKSSLRPEQMEVFVHAAVCRDMLEPGDGVVCAPEDRASGEGQIFDVSNACLGFLNSMVLLAGLIESGQASGMIVSGEKWPGH